MFKQHQTKTLDVEVYLGIGLRFFIVSVLLVIVSFEYVQAQPAIEFTRFYDAGASGMDGFRDIYSLPEDGFIMCGHASGQIGSLWVVEIDENGRIVWEGTFGNGIGNSIIQTDAADYVIGGGTGEMFIAVRVSAEGEQIWRRQYTAGSCKAVIELKNGDFILAGRIDNVNVRRGYIIMIDDDGDVIWANQYQQNDDRIQTFTALRETNDGVVVGGWTQQGVWVMKIDLEGEIIWMQHHPVGRNVAPAYAMISSPDGGFLLTGRHTENRENNGRPFPYLLKIDSNGNRKWAMSYPDGVTEYSWCLISIDDTGYALVGNVYPDDYWDPMLIRTTADGEFRYREIFNFDEEWGWGGLRNQFYSIVRDNDGSIVCAGLVGRENTGMDGIVMKFEPEQEEPVLFEWTPEDTVFSVLLGDTITFMARARDQQGDELSNLWIVSHAALGEDSLGGDTTFTYAFEELGEYLVQCQVSDGEYTTVVRWHVTAEEFYINSYSPDSLLMTIQRDRELDFTLGVRAIEGLEPNYRWILTDRNQRQNDIGEEADVSHHFDLAGNFGLEGRVYHEDGEHSVHWLINVRSLLYWWTPHERELEIPIRQPLEFSVIPFEPLPDSLEFMWFIDGIDEEIYDLGLFHTFRDTGVHTVTAVAYDGAEADTVVWTVRAFDPNAVSDASSSLLPTEVTLYPAAPNPFNSTTRVRYFLPSAGVVRLSIYDSAGRLVQTLADGWQIAGDQRATLQGSDLPAGVYLLRLEAGSAVKTGKVVLLK